MTLAHDVSDFLISSTNQARMLGGNRSNQGAKEKLLVHEENDSLNLSLYLDQEVLDRFENLDPFVHLDQHNLQEFCLVLEGISHFIYLVWNATFDRSVTLMEMELQAEVDKFIMLMTCLDQQSNPPAPGQLMRLLFETGTYHADLSREELQRYQDANFYARKYCSRLETLYPGVENRYRLLAELRRFYRLGKWDKLRRINLLY